MSGWASQCQRGRGAQWTTKPKTQTSPCCSHIQQLVEEEHRLYEQGEQRTLGDAERWKLEKVQVELDRCWDLLRQRRALREVGVDPDQAQVRPAQVVENYEQ
ncbi:MAG: DUF2630 family protein [Nitrospira defluvii]|nr:DUF2630 family protein [Nitrospira defluvii]